MRPAADIPALMHTFAAGLRFDTELQFRARGKDGSVWCRLPTPETSAQCSGKVALMQAQAILTGQAPSAQALRRLTWPDASALTAEALPLRLSELAPRLNARWHPGLSLLEADAPVCCPALACWAGPQGLTWALVTGIELEMGAGAVDPHAFLLLDPRMSAPWAMGYNARLTPGKERWQGLDGEVQAARLLGLVELWRKADR